MHKLSHIYGKVKVYAVAHKFIAAVVAIAIISAGYGTYKHFTATSTATKYILSTVTKGTLVTSVSGSGQVAAENQVNILSNVSGTINSIYVGAGDEVASGQVIASIENADAIRTLNNAELSLETAQVGYEKAVKEAGDQQTSSSASDLAKAYQTGYNAIVSTSIDLPVMFSTLTDIYYTTTHSPYFSDINIASTDSNVAVYKMEAGAAFDSAKNEYNANFLRYKNISVNSSPEEISALLSETNTILQKVLNALSRTYTTMDYVQSKLSRIPNELTSDKATISSYVSKVNSDTTNVTNALTGIDNSKSSATTADLNMKSAELTVKQDEASLSDAQKALSDHQVKAPFAGLIAKVTAKQGDTASNGTNVATIVTKHQIVNISLNEIDAAKVAKDNKVTLTFDAIDGLTLAGHVTNVDLVGTVSQGVVTYTVEIAFDDTDSRVKPGMTVNANIITQAKQDVLMLHSSAVKTLSGSAYVQVLDQKYTDTEAAAGVIPTATPTNTAITVGISNDTSVEIVSGLNEGDQVVSRSVTSTTKTSTTPSLLSGIGGNRTGATAATKAVTR
jgi:HlyD family secretion protein